ncbi:hypothetical protein J4206_05090 [Candidatus Woesearchaeota archaeon]|nr:hypothetical protein [Candidatus Woesearchaeota archaeon]
MANTKSNPKKSVSKSTKCPKCGFQCVEDQVSVICPNCDYVHIKEYKWQGPLIKCPSCGKKAAVYKSKAVGRTFVCDGCQTVGRYVDDEELHAKVYDKNSDAGKKVAWLFEVPGKFWHVEDDSLLKDCKSCKQKHCAHCDVQNIIEVHQKEAVDFCDKHKIEVYITQDYIEIVHKR